MATRLMCWMFVVALLLAGTANAQVVVAQIVAHPWQVEGTPAHDSIAAGTHRCTRRSADDLKRQFDGNISAAPATRAAFLGVIDVGAQIAPQAITTTA